MTIQTAPTIRLNQQQLFEDFRTSAEILGASFDEDVVAEVFSTFNQFFITEPTTSSVMYRIDTRANRRISLRYMDFDIPHDPFVMALQDGLLTREGHPIEDLLPQLQAEVNMLGYGADFSAHQGFEKVWPFFHPFAIDDLHRLPAVPQVSRNLLEFYRKYDLYWVSLLAVDYRAKTMNIYFMQKEPGRYSTGQIAEMFTDLGFERPSDEELEICTNAFTIYPTFSWDTLEPQRLCFCMPATRPEDIPALSPLIDNFVAEAPVNATNNCYTFCPTYGKDIEPYLKLENDYSGREMDIIIRLIETLK